NRLEIKLLGGTAQEIVKLLKSGEAELAIAADLGEGWERRDRWPLFSGEVGVRFGAKHGVGSQSAIDVEGGREEVWLRRTYCELAEKAAALIRSHSLDVDRGHELTSERDLIALIETDLGVAFAPRSSCPRTLKQAPVKGMEMHRTVYLYGVAGRERTAGGSAPFKIVRAAGWGRPTDKAGAFRAANIASVARPLPYSGSAERGLL